MKTYNNHPLWYNEPLRLTEEQKKDPILVLTDFFQYYHLNDTREILWDWLTEVVSSSRRLSSDPHDQGNQLYFYERIEELIEAAYVLIREKFPKNNILEKDQKSTIEEKINSERDIPIVKTGNDESIYNKSKQLIEYVEEAPIYVITEVFKSEALAFLRDQLRDWLHVALSADCAIYEDADERRQLLSFQDNLLVFIEALFIIYQQSREKEEKESKIGILDKTRILSQEQIANPMQVIASFFEKFPTVYMIRELNDWLEAAICYGGPFPGNMSQIDALYTHRNMLCLIKSANRLVNQ